MIEDYLCGITAVQDKKGRSGIVASRVKDNIIWIYNDHNGRQLFTDNYLDLKILRKFKKTVKYKF